MVGGGGTAAGDPFAPLRREYLAGARERVAELQRWVVALQPAGAPPDPGVLGAIRQAAHQIRGSGGFYGFGAISAAAAVVEELALAALAGDGAAAGRLPAAVADLARAVAVAEVP